MRPDLAEITGCASAGIALNARTTARNPAIHTGFIYTSPIYSLSGIETLVNRLRLYLSS
jgi:hypothetical protein